MLSPITASCIFWITSSDFVEYFLPDHSAKQCDDRLPNSVLYEPKFFIALISEDFPEKCDIMIFFLVCFNSLNNGMRPFYD
jgi:hypothetical protein